MYFPYFRGRQFELIALRELVENSLLSEQVIPIIEPVKLSSTLINTIEKFNEKGRKIALINNPQVGSLHMDLENEKNALLKEKFKRAVKFPVVVKTHVFNVNSDRQLTKGTTPLMTICKSKDFISAYENSFTDSKPEFNLILDESVFRRRIRDNLVLLGDKFIKLVRNTDYADIDEPFSDDHIFYRQDGYIGFADYSIVGNEFSESGFAPYAVAIHIVYFDKEKSLRIRHFVSDTNDDITDPANKFAEAVGKLVKWNKTAQLDTLGVKSFISLYENESYPGLGTVKKLSIMHHIELISRYLDKENEQ
ncbi:MAG: sce7725 family protein [Desulfosporosinus sp.]|nr:sce7725 family protein [Desulfosporosinus sp.]